MSHLRLITLIVQWFVQYLVNGTEIHCAFRMALLDIGLCFLFLWHYLWAGCWCSLLRFNSWLTSAGSCIVCAHLCCAASFATAPARWSVTVDCFEISGSGAVGRMFGSAAGCDIIAFFEVFSQCGRPHGTQADHTSYSCRYNVLSTFYSRSLVMII